MQRTLLEPHFGQTRTPTKPYSVIAAIAVVNSPLGTLLQAFFCFFQNQQRDQICAALFRGYWKSVQTLQNIILKQKSYLKIKLSVYIAITFM